MATLATAAPVGVPGGDPYLLRDLPNEDIYLFLKRIDNSRLVKEQDPKAGRRCWRFIAALALAALVLIGVLLPGTYSMLAGYQIQTLKAQREELLRELAVLKLRESELLRPQRLLGSRAALGLGDPRPGGVVVLPPRTKLARRQAPP